jgi:hypothetical protein
MAGFGPNPEATADGCAVRGYFTNQYSSSDSFSLMPAASSVLPELRDTPWMPDNFPVPPVMIETDV